VGEGVLSAEFLNKIRSDIDLNCLVQRSLIRILRIPFPRISLIELVLLSKDLVHMGTSDFFFNFFFHIFEF
jgi:hypothetical protein